MSKTDRIPLAGSINKRPYLSSTSTVDQRFVACYPVDVPNPETGAKQVYCEKRAGLLAALTVSGGNVGGDVFYSPSLDQVFTAFGSTSTIYKEDGTSLGTLSSGIAHFNDCQLTVSGSQVTYIMVTASDGTGWFWGSDATDTSIGGDTHTNTTIDNITGLTGSLYVGQKITGTGIQAGTRIASIVSATSITTTIATTASATITITVELIAKIIDSDFPTSIRGMFAEIDGFVGIMDSNGRVYTSDLNSITVWGAASFFTCDAIADKGAGIIRYGEYLLAFGTTSIEILKNAGNPTGSPLSRVGVASSSIGASRVTGTAFTIYCYGHDNVFWMDKNTNIYTMDGLKPKKITGSTMMDSVTITGMSCFTHARKRLVNIASTATGTNAKWIDVDSGMVVQPGFSNRTYIAGPNRAGTVYAVDDGTSGKMYVMYVDNQAVFQDNGSAYSMIIQTTKIDHGSAERTFVERVDLIADNQASGTTTLETNDEDYAANSWVNRGTFDMTANDKYIIGCGSHHGGRAYRLTHSANTAWRGQYLDITYRKGTG